MSSSQPGPSSTSNLETLTLGALGWSPRYEPYIAAGGGATPARVVRHDGSAVLISNGAETFHVQIRPSMPVLAVGDWISVVGEVFDDLLPRASLLQRRNSSTGGSQPIAANVDVVGIVCGLDRPINSGRIQRFTSLAWDAGASPLIILSKSDLVDSIQDAEDEIRAGDPAAEIISVSAETHDGITTLLQRCQAQTLVLVGESGAGKSTLLNSLAGQNVGATGPVRDGDSKGRHTTTSRQLFVLDGNCCLIDTPGVREVGIFTDVDTIDDGFGDITLLAESCRFGDCAHRGEPGCAVETAVTDGLLDAARIQAWEKLRKEAEWLERRGDKAAENRFSREWNKTIRTAVDRKNSRP